MSISYDMLDDAKSELIQLILDNEDKIIQNLIDRVQDVYSFDDLEAAESLIREVL